jgi:hypothetical protein
MSTQPSLVRSVALGASALLAAIAFAAATAASAGAAITPSTDASTVAGAATDSLGAGEFTSAAFQVIPPQSKCDNGFDDDGDGLIDLADPDCESVADNLEFDVDPDPACDNGFDDDGDVLVDSADPGCTAAADNNEADGEPDPTPECDNGFDDDGDGLVDLLDPGCTAAGDLAEASDGPPVPTANAAATSDSSLAGFPTSGATFAILSSGDAQFADDPNGSGDTGIGNGGGGGGHGESIFDLVKLRIDLAVPAGVNCLSMDFRFLSEEYPEFVGSTYNDAFVAELDTSNFSVDVNENIVAPNNFAFDEDGDAVSVNTAGFSESNATGTTYDGATGLLQASTPITAGPHSIYLSIFDQGDGVLDSAAFIDRLRLRNLPPASCTTGATTGVGVICASNLDGDPNIPHRQCPNGFEYGNDNPNYAFSNGNFKLKLKAGTEAVLSSDAVSIDCNRSIGNGRFADSGAVDGVPNGFLFSIDWEERTGGVNGEQCPTDLGGETANLEPLETNAGPGIWDLQAAWLADGVPPVINGTLRLTDLKASLNLPQAGLTCFIEGDLDGDGALGEGDRALALDLSNPGNIDVEEELVESAPQSASCPDAGHLSADYVLKGNTDDDGNSKFNDNLFIRQDDA